MWFTDLKWTQIWNHIKKVKKSAAFINKFIAGMQYNQGKLYQISR